MVTKKELEGELKIANEYIEMVETKLLPHIKDYTKHNKKFVARLRIYFGLAVFFAFTAGFSLARLI